MAPLRHPYLPCREALSLKAHPVATGAVFRPGGASAVFFGLSPARSKSTCSFTIANFGAQRVPVG